MSEENSGGTGGSPTGPPRKITRLEENEPTYLQNLLQQNKELKKQNKELLKKNSTLEDVNKALVFERSNRETYFFNAASNNGFTIESILAPATQYKPIKEQGWEVFGCYRRFNGAAIMNNLDILLRIRGIKMFMDVELGCGIVEEDIMSVIEQCRAFVIVLTDSDLQATRNPLDWVRREIERAMKLKKRIVPVLAEKFIFPESDDKMGASVNTLKSLNWVRWHQEHRYSTVEKIIGFLNLGAK